MMYTANNRKNGKKTRLLGILAAALALLCACGRVPVTVPELLTPVSLIEDTTAVTRRDIANYAQYTGVVRATGEELRFGDINLRVKELYALAGDYVQAGDVLVRLDTWQLEDDLALLQKQYNRTQETHAAELRVLQADAAIARTELDRLLWLTQENENANNQDGADQSRAIVLKTSEWDSLSLRLEQAKQRQAEELSFQQREMARIQGKIQEAVLTAPFDGVVSQSSLLVGTAIKSHETVMVLTNLDAIHVEISKKQLYRPGPDDILTATTNGADYTAVYIPTPNTEIAAHIAKGLTPPQRFALELAETDSVAVGQYVVVMLQRDTRQNVLTVPVNAVYYSSGQPYVYRQERGAGGDMEKTPVFVGVGVRTESYAEITEGLSEGDVVFVN